MKNFTQKNSTQKNFTGKKLTHFSAGGIVLRRIPDDTLSALIIQHRKGRGWGFPKGWIEDGEKPQQAALREVEEETGAVAEIVKDLPSTHYTFTTRQNEFITKTVTWYLMRYLKDGDQTHAHEVSAVEWIPLPMVHARLTHQNDKDLFSVALKDIMALNI